MRSDVWIVIGGMALATYLTRAPLMLILARRPLPPRLRLWLRLIPLAVLPALAVPLIVLDHGRLAVSTTHPPLWGAAVVLVLAACDRLPNCAKHTVSGRESKAKVLIH